jgi:hypothetical protein
MSVNWMPRSFRWDYTRFGKADPAPREPDETIEMLIVNTMRCFAGRGALIPRSLETVGACSASETNSVIKPSDLSRR